MGFYYQERWATDSREGSPVGVSTFVGRVGFYSQERWATDSREGSVVGVLTFEGRLGFFSQEMIRPYHTIPVEVFIFVPNFLVFFPLPLGFTLLRMFYLDLDLELDIVTANHEYTRQKP